MNTAAGGPIAIAGLWAIKFTSSEWGGVSAANPTTLYFTAGPGGEKDGVFGTLTPSASGGGWGGVSR
jgi:hypothetical protein